ncbi:hypothetical protein [Paracoccus aminophilus]|uniref:Uncharacterized protein n=1 Tax=Paracoccus aminophilus JCM 7686 TaxID=1367847 RepID=S5YFR8_PARAH|nr:hypothetical protein [Paracoccus aminophilus]AGT10323.1 hypothetical protein JCM7686_3288 [Paracoccus aminophilus JCM 7686]
MAEPAPQAHPAETSENIGDVLASIRRLIAQDEANRASSDPGQRLRQVALQQAEERRSAHPTPSASEHEPPLVLGHPDLVPPARPPFRQPTLSMPRMRPAAEDRVFAAQATGGPVVLNEGGSPRELHQAPVIAPQPQLAAVNAEAIAAQTDAPAPLTAHAPAFAGRPLRAETPPSAAEIAAHPDAAETPPAEPALTAHVPAESPTREHPLAVAPPPPAALAEGEGESEDFHLFLMPEDENPHEELLRGLIREAIRDELQGELGGQFSRNLRRVIRSEIELALRRMGGLR